MNGGVVLELAKFQLIHCITVTGRRMFWSSSKNKPPWWPAGVTFKCPNHPGVIALIIKRY